jgi:catechol 2,3-dioxygenase-like lactoylglutathione lyase family enzyme
MTVRRVVPDLTTRHREATRDFYVDLIGLEVVMDLGWVVTYASPSNPTAQLIVMQNPTSDIQPNMSIEVADVDDVHAQALRRGDDIVYPLTDEPWGVRRFFVRDPNGVVVNVLEHREAGPP